MWWLKVVEYFSCDKYKKLYEEEKTKYEYLKLWTEKLLESKKELIDKYKNK